MSEELNEPLEGTSGESLQSVIPVSGLYKNWFLDYASYVILERAVPYIEDGFKPVQRRILHAMKEMDDGRFNKVANIIGSTMQYHPHGDASINDAIVGLGQKDLLIDTQGNWGDVRTGDGAAAARYIEARLSKFALDVVFNEDTTDWQTSYDGRKREPVTLPVKFPLLLAQGVEGIAVGLSTKILPHNFCELIDASIKYLKNEEFELYPDFLTGGFVDVTNYMDGQRGAGRVRVRAKIKIKDTKTLLVTEIPFGTTTGALIESIIKASEKGKIKVKKVIDNTAKDVEIEIQLQPGTSPDITIDALYAFTDCEMSISPNACVVIEDKPHFIGVSDILRLSTDNTKELLRRELEIKKADLMEKIFFSSLEKIFIREEMYIDFKLYSDKPTLFQYLDKRFEPFKELFYREITTEDYEKLTQIPMIRITRFDAAKADEKMKSWDDELKQVIHNLKHLTDFSVKYYENLLAKYGKGRERKTEIRKFDQINVTAVAANNEKLYVNRKDGFVGFGLKKDELVQECSDIDDVIAFTASGICKIVKIAEKTFIGKDIIHVAVFKKNDDRMVYNMIYLDALSGKSMVKRFQITAITRDKEYDLTMGNKGSKVLYFSANPNGEAEVVAVTLTPSSTAKIKIFDYNFADLDIKGRNSQGNTLTKYPVKKIVLKEKGRSTLGGIEIWYDEIVGRLNTEQRGEKLGGFQADDKILVIYKNGELELTSFELTNRYEQKDIFLLERYKPERAITAIHFDGASKNYFVKRFRIENQALNKRFLFIGEAKASELVLISTAESPQVELEVLKGVKKEPDTLIVDLDVIVDVKGWKAMGNRLSQHEVKKIKLLAKTESEDIEKSSDDLGVGDSIDLYDKSKDQDQMTLF
ncbi:MAG: DNA gyrase/topoisomerase IV subunit A [Cytophagales bacterium]